MANTLAVDVDDSQISLMKKAFLIAGQDNLIIDQVTTIKEDFKAKQIDIPIFSKLAKATTPLVDDDDVDAVKLVDTSVTLTPVEQGNVVTVTNLANIVTDGIANLAAFKLIGINMGETGNALGIQVGEDGSNILLANGAATEDAIVAADIIQPSDLNYIFNRMSRKNVPKFPMAKYFALAHPDVIEDVKLQSAFIDVQVYADANVILNNELGIYKGFRWLESAGVSINSNAGAVNVDTYHTQFFGMNGFGKAISEPEQFRLTGPFDRLARKINFGWYGVYKYSIVDSDAHWIITSSSSLGSNV